MIKSDAGAEASENHRMPVVVNSPSSDVVQEGEFSVHQAGQEGDLPTTQEKDSL